MLDKTEKKIMPLGSSPIEEYPLVTLLLSIMFLNQKEAMPWFCNHFISIKAGVLPYHIAARIKKETMDFVVNNVTDVKGKEIITYYYNIDEEEQVFYRIPLIRRS